MPLIENDTQPAAHFTTFSFHLKNELLLFTALARTDKIHKTANTHTHYLPRIYASRVVLVQNKNKYLLKEKLPFDFERFDFPSACVRYFAG